ncbi:MAG: Hpt domain-containing protein [Planctomycetaceae bacterium]
MSSPIFDYQALCERVAGRLDVVEDLIQMLRSSFPSDRQQLLERLDADDSRGARDVAHRIKGQLQTLGINRAADQARCIEYLARDGHLDRARTALADLDREFREFEESERVRAAG